VKVLIKILKINPKNEINKAESANDKSTENIDKAREIGKALAKVYYD
jgi:hypothetical protein